MAILTPNVLNVAMPSLPIKALFCKIMLAPLETDV